MQIVILILVTLISSVIILFLRRWAIMDIPNERSSHSIPTPRGGGVAIVAAFDIGLIALLLQGMISLNIFIAFFLSGLIVAIIGFIDDRGHVPARIRLIVHAIASISLLVGIGGMPPLELGFVRLEWGILGHIIGTIGLIWMINLYNFMDGIDGLAGSEAVFVAAMAGLFILLTTGNTIAWLTLTLAAASVGFLVWNWSPAKIFMGDVGSGFLGLMLGGMAILSSHTSQHWLWTWLILLAVFIVDATVTLIRRFLRGEKIWEAHRSHAYQHASDKYGHAQVTLFILLINFAMLLPLALLTNWFNEWASILAIISIVPLVLFAIKSGSGSPKKQVDRKPI